jgi:hypothetical protein
MQSRLPLPADGRGAPSRANGGYGVPISELFCGVVPASVFSRFGGMLRLEGSGGLALQRLSAEGLAWVPCLGNLFALTAVALALALNGFAAAGAPEAIFMVAPLLLLLSQDPLLLPGLAERQRYFPPQAAVTCYLAAAGALHTAGGAAALHADSEAPAALALYVARNLGLAGGAGVGVGAGGPGGHGWRAQQGQGGWL